MTWDLSSRGACPKPGRCPRVRRGLSDCRSRLLDDRGPAWLLAPTDAAGVARRYLPDTNALETTFETASGRLQTVDFMPHARGVRDPCIVRQVTCLSGAVELRCEVGVGPGLGAPVSQRLGPGAVPMRAGDRRAWRLRCDDGQPILEPCDADAALAATVASWREWATSLQYDGPYREAVVRSALALKLLVYEPTGAVIAAPTTSLPEVAGGVRNWDYRYCWLRDASMALAVLMELGMHDEAMAYWPWITRVADAHEALSPLYTVSGEAPPRERTIEGVTGHADARPVRVGNAAAEQLQLDVLGYLAAAAHRCQVAMDQPHEGLDRVVAQVADRAAGCWRDPDNGLWERRGPARDHIHGKLMCWVALDRALRLAERGWTAGDTRRWAQARDEIARTLREEGPDPRDGGFGAVLGGGPTDASALRVSAWGLLEATDPAARATLAAVDRDLTVGPHVYRYRDDDGLPGEEGAFFLCSFWRVEALAAIGRRDEAERAFEALVASGNDVGLLSEEIDPASGALLGNFPQAFSHLGLIRAALALDGRNIEDPDQIRRKAS